MTSKNKYFILIIITIIALTYNKQILSIVKKSYQIVEHRRNIKNDIINKSEKHDDRIRIVGSSTLYPYISVIAERFAKKFHYKTPIIESNGTGAGINLFCAKNSNLSPDVVAASRRIKQSELQKCKKNGIHDVKEILLGYEAVVLVVNKKSKLKDISSEDMFKALSAYSIKDNHLIPNINKTWKDINNTLPNYQIEIYGPSFSSGTRDILVEKIMIPQCINNKIFKEKFSNENDLKSACKLIRNDGHYIDMGENDNVIIHKIESNSKALGLVGFSFYNENKGRINSLKLDSVTLSKNSILNQKYHLLKDLYIYINMNHVAQTDEIKEFMQEATSEDSMGPNGYLVLKGFIKAK